MHSEEKYLLFKTKIAFWWELLLFSHWVVLTLVVPWTVTHQTPLPTGFFRQEYWSGLPSPSLWDLPDPGIKPTFPALAGGLITTELPGRPSLESRICQMRDVSVVLSTLLSIVILKSSGAEFSYKNYGDPNQEKHSYLELFTSEFPSFESLIRSPKTCFIFPPSIWWSYELRGATWWSH